MGEMLAEKCNARTKTLAMDRLFCGLERVMGIGPAFPSRTIQIRFPRRNKEL